MTASRLRRRALGAVLLLALLVAGCTLSLAVGARPMSADGVLLELGRLPETLAHPAAATADGRVIAELRLPRTILAILVGAALGVAGALIQGHTRNPLADPGIIGVSAGAAFAVVLGSTVAGVAGTVTQSVLAFVGAIAATATVFALASLGRGPSTGPALILGGAALTAVLSSFTSAIILTDRQSLDEMRRWTVGSVSGRELAVAWGVAGFIVIGVCVACATAGQLNLLNLGDDAASALGVNVRVARILGIVLIALLAGCATAAAGPVGFVGLVVPHIVRVFTGPDFRRILPYSALAGSVLMLLSDVLGRVVARPGEIPVGIVLAFVGAPFFIVLIYRRRVVGI